MLTLQKKNGEQIQDVQQRVSNREKEREEITSEMT